MKRILLLLLLVSFMQAKAQENFPINGVADERSGRYAFTNATIYIDFQTMIQNATLLIEDGKVMDAGVSVNVPKGTQTIDLGGKFIYPAFVDPYSGYGIEKPKRGGGFGRRPQLESNTKGPFGWNESVKAEFNSAEIFTADSKKASDFRKHGFGSVLSFRNDGVIRGTGTMVLTGDGAEQDMVIVPSASFHFSFDKGSSRQNYPSSIMGMSALIRQTYYDAEWYRNGGANSQTNLSLAAFNSSRSLPQVFEANGGKLRVLLADQIGDEFGERYIIKGSGDEYQRVREIKNANVSLIIPVDYPDAYDVSDALASLDISMEDLKHWEMAPMNPIILNDSGVEFAFTASGLKSKSAMLKNIRKSVELGLPKEAALKALTYTPARYYGAEKMVGTLKKGSYANFFISSGDIFDSKSKIHQTWVKGISDKFQDLDEPDVSGNYALKVGSDEYSVEVSSASKAKIIVNDSTSIDVTMKLNDSGVQLSFETEDNEGQFRLSGWSIENGFKGSGKDPMENWLSWSMVKESDLEKEKKKEGDKKEEDEKVEMGEMMYPFTAFGWSEKPAQESIIFKNATVWTMEEDGVIENGDVWIKDGKIVQVGKNLQAAGAREVDATGMHITPGIIDEHSHIALSGVNEGSNAVTSEVRMYDAIDSEDIDIYRQLSGGVVAAQLLHGSANPVGGQSALIKFRWGSSPEEMKIKNADGFIKFALGENVKQSNWGDLNTVRFPQTRMGVEQVYVNAFNEARAYDAEWKKYNSLPKKTKATATAPRRDLQLEALAEIINKERFITCHSYVQSEINMLMKVAESFGFRVNAFTHILEGYKVADKMAEHGVGGSTFSDWWAYKYEVREAIPYNAALMTKAGVTVAINSDDGEMARRLNQEAAKSIKYGNMDEIEAMKMVTINPAKLLHLDDRMGSLKVGKDADVVVWTDHPLSVYAKAQMTLVDGRLYFDRDKDLQMQNQIREERVRLINKMKSAKKNGAKTKKYVPKEKHRWDCEEFVIEETE